VAPTTTTTLSPTTTTTEATTTTTEGPTTTPPPSLSPTTLAPSIPTTLKVGGVVAGRPLPRTGNDFGIQVIVGAGLTAAGLAFAVMARLRRQRVNAPASS